MQTTFAIVAALAAGALAAPQGVTADITPTAPAPAGCSAALSSTFELIVVNTTSSSAKRSIPEKRDTCGGEGTLVVTLSNGILLDAKGRTGYIAENFQFQFDKPAQTGAIYTGGFSACSNGSLALGGSATFYQCLSGSFYNLYDRSWAAQCGPVDLFISPCGGSSADPPVGQSADGQATGTAAPISQIGDGQPQGTGAAPKPTPISQITDGQIQAPGATAMPLSQISDGQIQAPTATGAPLSQISDGQVQATTAAPKPTGAPVSQISDGQVQATTAAPKPTGNPVSQISDGQIQATTAAPKPSVTGPVVSQIGDGQIQASNSTATSTSIAPFTGSASGIKVFGSTAALIVGVIAAAFL